MEPFDPKRLSLPGSRVGHGVETQKPPRPRKGKLFLKGPIPWDWLAAAARQSGKAVQVALALWFLAGVKRADTVALSNTVLKDLGVDRYAKARALERLEKAGLVSVDRHPGRNPVVRLLEVEEVD